MFEEIYSWDAKRLPVARSTCYVQVVCSIEVRSSPGVTPVGKIKWLIQTFGRHEMSCQTGKRVTVHLINGDNHGLGWPIFP